MLGVPEQPAPHGARRAQRQGDHGPQDRGLGARNYTRNVGYKTGSITYEFETKTFNYDRGIRLLADVMDVEEAGVLDCFVAAGSELQRTQVAPEAVRCVGALTGSREPDEGWDDDVADAWRRAVCAAADAFAEYGEGRVGGFSIGSFSVTNYRDDGTTGAEVAREAALAELAGTGLAFAGVR